MKMDKINSTRSFTIKLVLLYSLSIILSLPAFAKTMEKESQFFFPYQNCTVCKIDGTVHPGSGKFEKTLVVPVTIEKVLRGRLKPGTKIDLYFLNQEDKALLNHNCAPGKRKVFVFDGEPFGTNNFILASRIYLPFPKDDFTENNLTELKKKLETLVYEYQACLLCNVQSVALKIEDGKENAIEITAKIEDPIIDNSRPSKVANDETKGVYCNFKKGQIIVLRLHPSVSKDIFPKNSLENLRKNSRCVWSFDPSDHEGNRLSVWAISTPFPGQKFSDDDIKRLKEKIGNQSKKFDTLYTQIENRIKKKWTIEQIRNYSRPETEDKQLLPMLKSLCWPLFEGTLYKEHSKELGKITWQSLVWEGNPTRFGIHIIKDGGNKVWRINEHFKLTEPIK